MPAAITAGPDGALWFAVGNAIGRITTSGQITYFPLRDSMAEVGPLAAGPDHGIWSAQSYGDTDPLNSVLWGTKIIRVTT